jgi:formylglycine-generating enzyme required for sulfatase activity
MGGNVWEWCEDEFNTSGLARVLRGASWSNDGRVYLTASFRGGNNPGGRDSDFGFRCVLVPSR